MVDALAYQTPESFKEGMAVKAKTFLLVTNNVNILQTNTAGYSIAGIMVTTSGDLTLIDNNDLELPAITVTAGLTVYPITPKKVKTGSTAVIYAAYGG